MEIGCWFETDVINADGNYFGEIGYMKNVAYI
jgi:hypothetical protein